MVTTRLSYRRAVWIAAIGPSGSLVAITLRWFFLWISLNKSNPDFTLDILNFAVVLLPFAFSIFVAFVPDMRSKHIAWRTLVILFGIGFSWMLWKQQHLAAEATKRDQNATVNDAVNKANEHSDEQIAGVKSDIQKTNDKIDKLPSQISNEIETNTQMLTRAFVKVNPYALNHARLQFSLFIKDVNEFPITDYYFPRQDDGSVNVQFQVKNVSEDTSTGKGDLWIQICRGCSYPNDPPGFVRREGSDEHVRHRTFDFLNAGIAFEPMSLSLRPPSGTSVFQVSFKYSCETCGGITDWQTVTVRTGEIRTTFSAQPKKAKPKAQKP